MSNKLDKIQIKALICKGLEWMGGSGTWNQTTEYVVEHGYDALGTTALAYEQNSNITYWIGSQNFIESVAELRIEGLIDLVVVSPLLYTMDGAAPDMPVLFDRRLGILLRDWDNPGWIKEPVWIPMALILAGIDFFEKPITAQMLRAALDSSDDGVVRQDMFETLVSSKAGEPFDGDDEGKAGRDG